MVIDMKKCSTCHELKSESEFSKNAGAKDGLRSYCKACAKIMNADWYSENRDKLRVKLRDQKRRQRSNPEYREAEREKNRVRMRGYYAKKGREQRAKWRAANPEKVREANHRAYAKHPEKYLDKQRRWYKANPDKVVAYRHARRAREQAGGTFTAAEWQALKVFYDFTCLRCGAQEPEIKLTPDHVKPLVGGGSNAIDNIQPLCGSCNNRKSTKEIDYR